MNKTLLDLESEYQLLLRIAIEGNNDCDSELIGVRLDEIDIAINQTPAQSPAGLRVKFKRLWQELPDEHKNSLAESHLSIMRDLENLQAVWQSLDPVLQLSD